MIFPQQKERRRSAAILATSIILAICLLAFGRTNASAATTAAPTVGGFTDVKAGDYFAEPVMWAVEQEITSGTSATTFSPGKDCTVAEILTFLWRANGSPNPPEGSFFSNVKASDYYADAAAWAYGKGMIPGGTFDADAPCTRSMAVTYMWDVAGSTSTGAASFTDVAAEAEYADAVAWAVEQGVTSGTSATTFSPDAVCTRGEIVTFLYRGDGNVPVTVPDSEEAPAYDVATPPAGSSVAASTGAKTTVKYGTSSYPNLGTIDYGTYRKLDYQRVEGKVTYLYDFRDEWIAGAYAKKGDPTSLASGYAGYYGIVASTDKNVLTYTLYNELDNVTVKSVQFLTFDNAQSIALETSPDEEHTCRTGNLENGPYILGAWFDYTDAKGTVTTVSIGRPVYVSGGDCYFADYVNLDQSKDIKAWLSGERNSIAADDAFQAWVDAQGGNDMKKATDASTISYPFKSGTSRYPNETSKWQALAHEICPDDTVGDYTKAAKLFTWMRQNLAYDRDTVTANLDYRWATAASQNTAKGFTTWDSHVGECLDFANIYAIMCRELGIPCHVIGIPGHCFNIAYLHGHWEIIDPTNGMRKASLGTDNKAFVENTKNYWTKQKTGDDYTAVSWYAFGVSVQEKLGVTSYEANKYPTIEKKLDDQLFALNHNLMTQAYFNRYKNTIYGH